MNTVFIYIEKGALFLNTQHLRHYLCQMKLKRASNFTNYMNAKHGKSQIYLHHTAGGADHFQNILILIRIIINISV